MRAGVTALLPRFEGSKVPREAPPPSKWGLSKSGSTRFVLRKVGYRNKHGAKLYRLGYFMGDGRPPLFSQQLWTLKQLVDSGVRWLKESPFTGVNEEPTDDVVLPKGVEPDEEDDTEDVEEPAPQVLPFTKEPPPQVLPATFEERFGFGVGAICQHSSGKLYRVIGIVDPNTARVEQFIDGDPKKLPARNMAGDKLSPPEAKK